MLTWRGEHNMVASPRLLGEILVQEGLTTPDVVQRALARADTSGALSGEALVARGAALMAAPNGRATRRPRGRHRGRRAARARAPAGPALPVARGVPVVGAG